MKLPRSMDIQFGVYHLIIELNPIKLIWALVKSRVAKRNTTYKLRDVEILVNEELGNVIAGDWQKTIQHVEKIEKLCAPNVNLASEIPQLLIPLFESNTWFLLLVPAQIHSVMYITFLWQ